MTISNKDFTSIVNHLISDDVSKSELKSAAITKGSLRAGFNAINDDFESKRLALKGVIDTAMGITTTNAFAKKLGRAWLKWKWGVE